MERPKKNKTTKSEGKQSLSIPPQKQKRKQEVDISIDSDLNKFIKPSRKRIPKGKKPDTLKEKEENTKRNPCWRYFELKLVKSKKFIGQQIVEIQEEYAFCNFCENEHRFKTKNNKNVTRNMKDHLLNKHSDNCKSEIQPLTQTQFNELLVKDLSLRMVPFSFVFNSESLKTIQKYGQIKIPSSYNEIHDILIQFFMMKKKNISNEILDIPNQKLFLSIDGTSIMGRRFINVFVYTQRKQVYFLGLLRVTDQENAQNIIKLIHQILKSFRIEKDRVHCLISDSASNLKRVSKIQNWNHIRCLSHFLHNSLKALFKKCKIPEASEESEQNENDSSENENDDKEQVAIENIIKSIRKTVKRIKASPKKQDALKLISGQTYLNLSIDTPTRWNSTLSMIHKYLEMQSPLELLSKSHQISFRIFTNRQSEILKELIFLLENVEHLQMKIQSPKCSILSAEKYILSFIDAFQKIDNQIFQQYIKIMKKMYPSYRNKELLSVGYFLKQNVDFYQELIKKHIFELLEFEEIESFLIRHWGEDHQSFPESKTQFKSQVSYQSSENSQFDNHKLQKEIDFYKSKGCRGEKLRKILQSVRNCPAQSVINERGFSILGKIFTKSRSQLSDTTLNSLTFLYYAYKGFKQEDVKI